MPSPQRDQPDPRTARRGSTPRRVPLRTVVLRLLLAAGVWWIISEGQVAALPVGVAAVFAAVALSLALAPPARHVLHPLGLLLFLGYFLRRSIVAGVDVAWRILQPVPRCHPVLSRVTLYLPGSGPRALLADCISLLPGTLCVAIEGDVLVLHRLSDDYPDAADVRDAERRIARMFNLQLETPQ